MTRNTDHYIEVGQYPKSEEFPTLEPRWWVTLTLEPHADADVSQGVQIIFRHTLDTEEQARGWGERLDMMLAYGSIRFSRTYDL